MYPASLVFVNSDDDEIVVDCKNKTEQNDF